MPHASVAVHVRVITEAPVHGPGAVASLELTAGAADCWSLKALGWGWARGLAPAFGSEPGLLSATEPAAAWP